MLKIKFLIFLFSILILSGCASSLKKELALTQIANDTGVEASAIRDVIRAEYTVTSTTSLEGVWQSRGILAITDTELFVYVDKSNSGKLEKDLRLPYSEMRGIACVNRGGCCQIQIVGDVGILALGVTKNKGLLLDISGSQKLYNYIKNKGVSKYTERGKILLPTGRKK